LNKSDDGNILINSPRVFILLYNIKYMILRNEIYAKIYYVFFYDEFWYI